METCNWGRRYWLRGWQFQPVGPANSPAARGTITPPAEQLPTADASAAGPQLERMPACVHHINVRDRDLIQRACFRGDRSSQGAVDGRAAQAVDGALGLQLVESYN